MSGSTSRAAAFLEYYDRERVQRGLVLYRRWAGYHGRRDRRLAALAGALVLIAAASAAALLGPTPELVRVGLQVLAIVAPAAAVGTLAIRLLEEHDRNQERFENYYLDIESLRGQAPEVGAADLDVARYVEAVEALLCTAAYGRADGRRG